MSTFTDFQEFEIASAGYQRIGHTVYKGDETLAARYIVGGLATQVVPHDVAGYAHLCLTAAIDLGTVASRVPAETLGVWHDNGMAYFDLGDTYYTLAMASAVARHRGELAIWDRVEGKELRV